MLKHDWNLQEAAEIYNSSFPDLIYRAQSLHRKNFDPSIVQRSTLLSVKTGGCPENCAYCPQSAHYDTGVTRQGMLESEDVVKKAREAQLSGSTRFCMGAAWREVKNGADFDRVLEMVRGVHDEGLEVCATLGMLTADQAHRLEEAGLHAYNHNVDSSPEFYDKIITTRTYGDR